MERVPAQGYVQIANTAVNLHQWHRRLCHKNLAAIKKLVKKGQSIGIKLASDEEDIGCEECTENVSGEHSKRKGAYDACLLGFMDLC